MLRLLYNLGGFYRQASRASTLPNVLLSKRRTSLWKVAQRKEEKLLMTIELFIHSTNSQQKKARQASLHIRQFVTLRRRS